MKDVIHAIFSLEFTQAVILFILGALTLIAEPVLASFKISIGIHAEILFSGVGCGLLCLSLASLAQFGPALAYRKASDVINSGMKAFNEYEEAVSEAIRKCPHANGDCGNNQSCPAKAALYKTHKERAKNEGHK